MSKTTVTEEPHLVDPADDAALIAEHQEHVARDADRAKMLAAVLNYRGAWLALAEALDNCERRELWRNWAYASFAVYCLEELKLSKQLVTRYRNALAFLRQQGAAAGPGVTLQKVELAAKAAAAAEAGEIPADKAAELQARALGEEAGAREVSAELEQARGAGSGSFKLRLFPEDGQTGPNPEVLARARKALDRFEVVAQPLRQRMPVHVIEALEIVAAYLENPADTDPDLQETPLADLLARVEIVPGHSLSLDDPIPFVPTSRAAPYLEAEEQGEVAEPVCDPEPQDSEESTTSPSLELPADLDARLKPKLLARGYEGNVADAALVLRYALKAQRRFDHMAEDHRAAAQELVQLGLLVDRAGTVHVSHDFRELLAALYEGGGAD